MDCKKLNKLFILLFLFCPISLVWAEGGETTSILAQINVLLEKTLFFDVSFGAFSNEHKDVAVPFVLLVLLGGGVSFTAYYGFINIRAFRHAIDVIRGKFDKKGDTGEVSHFRALTSALSATIGLGNIAGVAVAIQLGGPGAAVWMVVTAFFGMTLKFSSCTLSQLYRKTNADGTISGGPMYYIDLGLGQFGKGMACFGKTMACFYAFFVCFAAIGGGCLFQVNQTVEAINHSFGLPPSLNLYLGIVIAIFVGILIIGGVKRISLATSRLVPTMFVIYMLAGAFVLLSNLSNLPNAISTIFSMAFTGNAAFGGLIGVMMVGIQRGAFSNEAGMGSAAIVHAAAKTDEPVREGVVAMMGPFIDTVLVCLMTALVVVVTGTWNNPEIVAQGSSIGITITAEAFRTVIPWFPYVLTVCIALFAYSSMIAWCYYGERGWIYLWDHFKNSGLKSLIFYRLAFVLIIVYGAVSSLNDVIAFADMVFIALAFPNIICSVILAPKVREMTRAYMKKYVV